MMSRPRAVSTMLLVTLLWSIAGVVTRQLESAAAFETTFWRSAANALALGAWLGWQHGPRALWQRVARRDPVLWASGLCWAVMFTAFMVALALTTVANVLVTMALAPLFTALLARMVLGQRLPRRTWLAIVVAGVGIGWMYGSQWQHAGAQDLVGTAVALTVPLAGATMWTLLQHHTRQRPPTNGAPLGALDADLTPAVLIGATLSALLTGPLAWPWRASGQDVLLLCGLGVVQLAIPCVLAVAAGRVLKAPEAALLGLLEIVFGVALAWWGTSESPTVPVLLGGLMVVLALAGNEAMALREAGQRSLDATG